LDEIDPTQFANVIVISNTRPQAGFFVSDTIRFWAPLLLILRAKFQVRQMRFVAPESHK
jgi:hypothetical protein